MITENIKNLFSFIDYLHSSIPYLLSKQNLIDETNELLEKRSSIKLNENYKSKIEYEKIQLEVSEKFEIVEAEIIFPLKHKIKELNVAEINTPIINLTAYSDLFALQRNFDEEDLKLIFEAKQKYLDFRNETNFDYYLQFFFFELDRTLKEFYEFFKDDDFNEFSTLQTNIVTIESLDEQGIEKAVRKLIGNSNKLHFETFPEFLNYFKTNFNDVKIDERHSEAKRLLEQKKLKLENSTFNSEIDEVKEFSENAVKDFKHKLMLSFINENYKTKFNGGIDPYLIAIGKLYFEYENLYNSAKNKSDIFNYLSTLIKEKIINIGDVRSYVIQTFFELDKGFLKELHLPDFYDKVQMISKSFDIEYLKNNIDTAKWKIYLQSLRNDIEKYKSCNNEMLQMLHSHIYLQLDTIEKGILNIENLESNSKTTQSLKVGSNNVKPKITINLDVKETIFLLLKDFFEAEQQDEFKEVLTTFGTVKNKLIFKSNGNQFTDTFKKLFENNFILGFQKTDLINWIVLNFNFMYRNEVKEFKSKTVETIISGNQTPCKKPLIEIKNGQILKIDY